MTRAPIAAALGVLLAATIALLATPACWAGDDIVIVVPVKGEIDVGTSHLVRRAVESAKAAGAKLIVFELDTPGGRVDNALEISEAIEGAGVPTIAYVTRWAASAGALIALSCDKIVMAPGSLIGAAEPIAEDDTHQAKYVAALRAEFQARAEKKHYPWLLAVAMVDKEIEVYQDDVDDEKVLMMPDDEERARREGKRVKQLRVVNPAGKLLCLSAEDAVALGLAERLTSLETDLLHQQGLKEPRTITIDINWSENLVRFLTQSLVTGLLILIGIICLLAELKAPGASFPGVLGVLCFAAVFFGHHLAGLANYTEILLFVVGVLLIGIEIFILPGSMIVGVPGVILAMAGLVLSLQGFVVPDPNKVWQVERLRDNFFVLACSFGGAMVGFLAIAKYLPKSPVLKRLILSTEITSEEGGMPTDLKRTELVGRYGVAMTPLRPSGKIELDGRTLDVVTEGDSVDKGAAVQVVKVDGPSIVVAPVAQR